MRHARNAVEDSKLHNACPCYSTPAHSTALLPTLQHSCPLYSTPAHSTALLPTLQHSSCQLYSTPPAHSTALLLPTVQHPSCPLYSTPPAHSTAPLLPTLQHSSCPLYSTPPAHSTYCKIFNFCVYIFFNISQSYLRVTFHVQTYQSCHESVITVDVFHNNAI